MWGKSIFGQEIASLIYSMNRQYACMKNAGDELCNMSGIISTNGNAIGDGMQPNCDQTIFNACEVMNDDRRERGVVVEEK